jgi:hypothetical protein
VLALMIKIEKYGFAESARIYVSPSEYEQLSIAYGVTTGLPPVYYLFQIIFPVVYE